ncbi:MAG: right-handed parallel beta-helix repeat-containing protein, partial [Anaerolineae bacterium]
MSTRLWTIIPIPILVLLLCSVLLVAVGAAPSEPDHANAIVFYVDDDTCPDAGSGTQLDPYCRIQTAVEAAAEGDEIRVATGVYTGGQTVAADPWGGTLYTYTQVAFIDKGLTLLGGYAPPGWETSDPAGNPTVIDAQGYGRGITILDTDFEPVTVDGFVVTGGDYTSLGNPPGSLGTACSGDPGTDCGGGIYARASVVILRNSVVTGNVASRGDSGKGGGIYLWGGEGGIIDGCRVNGNTALGPSGSGGGMYTYGIGGPLTITGSTFQDNHAEASGGGMQMYNAFALVTLEDTEFRNNIAAGAEGGAVHIRLSADGDQLHVDRVRCHGNRAHSSASAVYLHNSGSGTPRVRLTNLLLSGNRVTATAASDAVVGVRGAFTKLDVSLAHLTAADNSAPTFLFAEPSIYADRNLTVSLANALLISFTNAFAAQKRGDS